MKGKWIVLKGIRSFLSVVLAAAYALFLHRYLCGFLHLAWQKEWWSAFTPPGLWRFLSSGKRFSNAFYHLENLLLERMAYASDTEFGWKYMTEQPLEETLPYLIAVLILVLLLLFLRILLSGHGRKSWFMLQIFLLSLPFCFREVPRAADFIGLLLLSLSVAAGSGKRKCGRDRNGPAMPDSGAGASEGGTQKSEERGRAGVGTVYGAAGICVLLAVTVASAVFLLPEKRYMEKEREIQQAKEELQEFGVNLADSMRRESHGKLPRDGKREADPDTVFRLTLQGEFASEMIPIYLKDYAAIHYGETSWEGYTREEKDRLKLLMKQTGLDEAGLQLFTGRVAQAVFPEPAKHSMWMRVMPVRKAKGRVFTAYGAWQFGVGETDLLPVSDLYMEGRGSEISQELLYPVYRLTRARRLMDGRSEWTSEQEALLADYEAYRQFAYETCLSVPERLDGLKEMMKEAPEPATLEDKLAVVKGLLGTYYEYTTEPGPVPEGKDFTEYFLLENKKGYCVHFASAAVLLLRSMGVPARYAEGYLVKEEDVAAGRKQEMAGGGLRIEMEISGERAHAWAEIWLDGVGFVPYEFTPGFDTAGIPMLNNTTGLNGNDTEPSPEPEPIPESDEPEPAEEKEEEKKEPEKEEEKMGRAEEKAEARPFFLLILSAAAVVLCILLAVLTIRIRRRSYERKSGAEKILYQYAAALKYYRKRGLLDAGFPENADRTEDSMDEAEAANGRDTAAEAFARAEEKAGQAAGMFYPLVLRARFSNREPSEEELRLAEEYTRRLWERKNKKKKSEKNG